MSNLPAGANNDPRAPYNIQETSFSIDVNVRGIAWYEYQEPFNSDEAIDVIKNRIYFALQQCGDIDVTNIDLSIY